MAEKAEVLEAIYSAIDEVNEELPDDEQIAKSTETVLVAKSGGLDSLALINLIGEVEDKIEDEFDASITLADENAMTMENSPFATIDSLAAYIVTLIEAESDE